MSTLEETHAYTGVPAECHEAFTETLREISALTQDETDWIEASWLRRSSLGWNPAWHSVVGAIDEAGRGEAVENLAQGVPGGLTDLPALVQGAARDALHGASVLDLRPVEGGLLRLPWQEGRALAQWAESATPTEIEIARALLRTWTGTCAELLACTTALLSTQENPERTTGAHGAQE